MELFKILKVCKSNIDTHKRIHWSNDYNGVLYLSKKIGELKYSVWKEAVNNNKEFPQGTVRWKWDDSLEANITMDKSKWIITEEFILQSLIKKNMKTDRCRVWKCEQICRAKLEQLTGREWPSTRHIGIMGNHGRQLEVDCYNEECKAGVEVQGGQHISPHHYNGHDPVRLDDIIHRDNLKVIHCMENGIKLYRVWLTQINSKSTDKEWDDILMPFIEELNF